MFKLHLKHHTTKSTPSNESIYNHLVFRLADKNFNAYAKDLLDQLNLQPDPNVKFQLANLLRMVTKYHAITNLDKTYSKPENYYLQLATWPIIIINPDTFKVLSKTNIDKFLSKNYLLVVKNLISQDPDNKAQEYFIQSCQDNCFDFLKWDNESADHLKTLKQLINQINQEHELP